MNYNNDLSNSYAHRLRDEFVGGDDGAYSKIYELYAKDIYAFGLSICSKKELVEDAMHDIFVDLYANRHNLINVVNLKYYFLGAFRNRLFFLLKRETGNVDIEANYLRHCVEDDFVDKMINVESTSEKENLVKRLLAKLNPHQQEAIYYRFIEGMSLEEISMMMNINYQSVKNLIHRAIKKLGRIELIIALAAILKFF